MNVFVYYCARKLHKLFLLSLSSFLILVTYVLKNFYFTMQS